MRVHFKRWFYLLVLLGYSMVHAGSYEDFFAAVKQDDATVVRGLLERGFDPDTLSPDRLGGLYLALREGSLKSARVLLDWPKTKVESRTPQDESPLMMAALKGHEDLAKRLIERGADVNKTGWTALHYAATGGHTRIIDLLLENHAYIDAESPNGTTPLMMAAKYGTPEAVRQLLEAGADPTLRNQLGLSAAEFARQGNREESASLLARALQARPSSGKW